MIEQAGGISSSIKHRKTILDYFFLVGGWLVSFVSLSIIGLIVYWAIKIPEKNINNLPIINAIKGDIRVQPDEPGGKSFNDENLSIYKNLENDPRAEVTEKSAIILNKNDKASSNLRDEIKIDKTDDDAQKDLNLAIEDALKEVINKNLNESAQLDAKIKTGFLKLYLGSFDALLEADEFKQFINRKNDNLFDSNSLKISEKQVDEKISFVVQLVNISSEEEGEKLCSILSNRRFSCLLFNE